MIAALVVSNRFAMDSNVSPFLTWILTGLPFAWTALSTTGVAEAPGFTAAVGVADVFAWLPFADV
jgi:hypothetical protein